MLEDEEDEEEEADENAEDDGSTLLMFAGLEHLFRRDGDDEEEGRLTRLRRAVLFLPRADDRQADISVDRAL